MKEEWSVLFGVKGLGNKKIGAIQSWGDFVGAAIGIHSFIPC